ncbi:MAG: DUF177 domain-containing protein [Flavobacteriaceae bacterium]|nr:DUF177 domain-containing protein [Bacteroidia bacterium]MBT8288831.1 DUF177 domain-containing protein [Bacteroidia bacterium]NNF76207.1 DUF177 domain-containing protein [Flavobacteriaceae bacterium]NNK72895.1 DUF177 domain-containing protein [Flavobacteriaceae bacterium]
MKELKEYIIQFVGLKQGHHNFEYQIGKTFFEQFDFDEFNDADVRVKLGLEKKSTLMEFEFSAEGTVNVHCDLTNEPFDLPIKNGLFLVVKFGESFSDDHEEILILPHGSHEINIAQYIYELIVLAMPSKRVHPGVKDGTLKSEMLKRLEELSPDGLHKNNEEIDPRWNTLKKLLTDKK